jgi:hypothetical protein
MHCLFAPWFGREEDDVTDIKNDVELVLQWDPLRIVEL